MWKLATPASTVRGETLHETRVIATLTAAADVLPPAVEATARRSAIGTTARNRRTDAL
jgi:hypothetical protein